MVTKRAECKHLRNNRFGAFIAKYCTVMDKYQGLRITKIKHGWKCWILCGSSYFLTHILSFEFELRYSVS